MAAVALALAASLAWGSSDFLAGIKSRDITVLSVLVVSQSAGLVLVLAAAIAWGGPLPDAGSRSGRRRPAQPSWSASRRSTAAWRWER